VTWFTLNGYVFQQNEFHGSILIEPHLIHCYLKRRNFSTKKLRTAGNLMTTPSTDCELYLHSPAATFAMYWTSLAAELRGMILEALKHEGNVAHCASVCREWQAAIEQHNFHSLKLTTRDIPSFNKMATRNFGLIRYIWYSIELRNYDCTECDLGETEDVMDTNRATVKEGMGAILCALSEHPPDGNMTLDISIHSPSDSQHHFKYIRFEPTNPLSSSNPLKHASHHDSVHSSLVPLPSIAAIERVFPDIEFWEGEDDIWTSMPQVACVTHLLLRRQTRRRWDPITLSRLIACLPNLQDMCFEPWREWGRWNQRRTDISKCSCTAGTTCK
jgi:hypothetical protein